MKNGRNEPIPDILRAQTIAPLDQIGWLAGEGEAFRAWAAQAGRWRVYDAGQVIYTAGDASDGIYGLGSGVLELSLPLVGGEPVLLHLAETGFWIGDAAELARVPRAVSLAAASRCRLLHLPSHRIHALLAASPEHWSAFYRLSMINAMTASRHLSEALALTVRARVCRHLLRLAEARSVVEITQDDLARLVGVARGTLRRCLAELAEFGAIDTRYRHLRVLDPEILARYRNEQ